MQQDDRRALAMDLTDALTDRSHGFTAGGRRFRLYPVTLGKMLLAGRLTESLGIRPATARANPYAEVLRVAAAHKETCCRILAIHATRTKREALDTRRLERTARFLASRCDTEDVAAVLVLLLTRDRTEALMRHIGLDREQERMRLAVEAKGERQAVTFGGLSTYGTLIDTACERYGWTLDYVVWGISYTNLRLLLADSQRQVYLSDEERRKSGAAARRVDGDDTEAVRGVVAGMRWD